ncbi:lactococcin 972 family bacteriocin [Bacillus sp. RC]|nr:lactococcin 972 family bacteriocin [Bacillus sp. RC]
MVKYIYYSKSVNNLKIKGEIEMISKKKLITTSLGAAILLGGIVSTNASASVYPDALDGGVVDLKPGTMSIQTVESVGGGTWEHWLSVSKIYSGYQHNKKTHSAAIQNSSHTLKSKWKSPGVLAEAYGNASASGNKAFWNTK